MLPDPEQVAPVPTQRTARDIDFHSHEWVSPACVHRRHDACIDGCPLCPSPCVCVCHQWKVPAHRVAVEKA